LSLGFVT